MANSDEHLCRKQILEANLLFMWCPVILFRTEFLKTTYSLALLKGDLNSSGFALILKQMKCDCKGRKVTERDSDFSFSTLRKWCSA